MPVRYIFVECLKLSLFSQSSIIQYMGLCVSSLPISLVMIERIYILCLIINIKSEVWTIIHCLGSGHQTMVCMSVCLDIYLYLFCNNPERLFMTLVSLFIEEPIVRLSACLSSNDCNYHIGYYGRYIIHYHTVNGLLHHRKYHYDVIKWKHFPRYCPFVWGIHRSSVESPLKGIGTRTFDVSLLSIWANC